MVGDIDGNTALSAVGSADGRKDEGEPVGN